MPNPLFRRIALKIPCSDAAQSSFSQPFRTDTRECTALKDIRNTVKNLLSRFPFYPMKMRRSFRKTLEDKADQLASEAGVTPWDTAIPSMLRREIALTKEQLEQLKLLTQQQMRRLLEQDCDIETEMRFHRQSIPWFMPSRFAEEQTLKQRLFDIEKERRSLGRQYQEKKQTLEDRLLSLLNKHQQLDI